MAHIHFRNGYFLGLGTWEERELWKKAKFQWSPVRKAWITDSQVVAEAVQGVPWTAAAMAEITHRLTVAETSRELSYAATTMFRPPVPEGLHPRTGKPFEPFPYQCAGVEYVLQRKDTLIADQPGLGKSVVAVLAYNSDANIKRVLIVCPASLKEHWRREFNLWKTRQASVGIAETKYREKFQDGFYKNGEPRFRTVVHDEWWPNTDVVIINYEQLGKFAKQINEQVWELLVADEAHALKTEDSGRTLFILGGSRLELVEKGKKKKKRVWYRAIEASRRLFLTGTPMMNRPIELWPIAHAFDPDGLGKDKIDFGYRFCEGHFDPSRGKFGSYVFDGASNLTELGMKLRGSFMIRRLKKDVLPELPHKFRQVVILDSPEIREVVAREDELAQALRLYEDSVLYPNETEAEREARVAMQIIERASRMGFDEASDPDKPRSRELNLDYAAAVLGLEPSAVATMFEEIAVVRRELGMAKLSAVIPWIKNFLDGGEKLIAFGYHTDVLKKLQEALGEYDPILLYGGVHPNKRQGLVDHFQENERCRLSILQIDIGVGLTMTRAKDCAWVEGDWGPTKLEQNFDRICRIGQTANKLMGFHLVANGSLDCQMAQRAYEKEEDICEALDS